MKVRIVLATTVVAMLAVASTAGAHPLPGGFNMALDVPRFDIDHQKAVGLTPNEDGLVEMRDRLAAMAGVEPGAPVERIVDATHRLLAEAPCAVVTATLDDALLVEERPNMPGTLVATNWSLALPKPLEDVETDPMVLGVARSFAARVS